MCSFSADIGYMRINANTPLTFIKTLSILEYPSILHHLPFKLN